MAPAAGMLALLVEGKAVAHLPAALVRTTISSAVRFAAGTAMAGTVSPDVLALAETVLKPVASSRVSAVAALLLLFAGTVAGFVAASSSSGVPKAAPATRWAAVPVKQRTDLDGEPLPDGAIARFGSVRLRHAGLSDHVCLADGKTVLTAGSDRVLRFHDLATGRQVRAVELKGKAGPGRLITLSPDGKTLAAMDKGKIVFWQVDSGKEVQTLPAPTGRAGFLCCSSDGNIVAVGTLSWRVTLYDRQSGKQRLLPLPKRKIGGDSTYHGCFSPDGRYLAAGGGWGEPLCVFEVSSGREIHRFDCYAAVSTFSPDSKQLTVCSMRNDKGNQQIVIRFFDLAGGKEVKQFPLGSNERYFSLAFSPDGKRLALGFSDNSCLLDCTTGRVTARLTGRPIHLSFSRDGKVLIGSTSLRLRLWNPATGKELHERPGDFGWHLATAMSDDGRLLASAAWLDRAVSLWDTSSGRLLRQLPLKGEGRYVHNLAFAPDGKTLAAGQYRGFLQFWNTASGKEVRSIQLNDPGWRDGRPVGFFQTHISPDGKYVSTLERVFTSRPGGPSETATRLGRWETATGKLLHQHPLSGEVRHCAWLADGQALVLPSGDGLALMEVDTGLVRVRVKGCEGALVTASPDDRLFAAVCKPDAGAKGAVRVGVWETATGKEVATVTTGPVAHLALAAGNRFLVTSDKQFLRLWDLATGKERRRWLLPVVMTDAGGETFVRVLQLSPDGRRAFTALADGTGLMWNLAAALKGTQRTPRKKEIAAWWGDLAAADSARAYAAVWRLAEVPEETIVPLLRKHLRPVRADFKEARKLIEELDSDTFAVREKAFARLQTLGRDALPALREALEKGPSLEVRLRLQRLVNRAAALPPAPEVLRQLRALQILERIASKEARRLLGELARGADHASQTREAKRTLQRLSRRASEP
jgi:WD40 repeat protein